jgi:hypothetical protein
LIEVITIILTEPIDTKITARKAVEKQPQNGKGTDSRHRLRITKPQHRYIKTNKGYYGWKKAP